MRPTRSFLIDIRRFYRRRWNPFSPVSAIRVNQRPVTQIALGEEVLW
jgi:hypothetical protein